MRFVTRHGTTNLFAALDVASGTVIGECYPLKRAAEFRRFLTLIDRQVPLEFGGSPKSFEREGWPPGQWRVFAVRTNERLSGNQSCLWDDLDFSVHVYATNDHAHDADELARRYDDRAGIETVIAELKGGFGIGKVSTECFNANEAGFLLKVLAFNLLRRWVQARHRPLASWRTPWLRRVCVQIPGRLLRSGGRWELRLAPRPMLS